MVEMLDLELYEAQKCPKGFQILADFLWISVELSLGSKNERHVEVLSIEMVR